MTKTDSKDLCTVANDGICRFDQTTVTLVPASFPEENQKAIVTVGLCQFGLMLETNYSRFFKFFNDQITLEKWGNKRLPPKNKLNLLNPVSQTEVEKLIDNRIDILSTIVNHFYQSVFPKVKIPTIGVLFTLEENYVAEYSPENHQIKVGYEVIYYSLSDLNKEFILKKDIASTLYHEIRHIDQVILCIRFMHGRGQNPISKLFKQANGEKSQWIDDALIPVAKNFDKTDPVQQGTNGKVTKGHRHYHCAVQLYASMFGDPEEEIKFNPNIYDDVDYPIPL